MKIVITMDLDPDWADPDHPAGITESGYNQLSEALMPFGSDIDVRAASGEEL